MRKILEKLWQGNIAPQTKLFNRGTCYDESFKMMCKNQENLKSILKDKERETFAKYCGLRDEVEYFSEEDTFITGFRLGARIIIESFYENDGLFSETNT